MKVAWLLWNKRRTASVCSEIPQLRAESLLLKKKNNVKKK